MSYEQAWAVTQTIIKEIEKTEVDIKNIDLKNILATDVLVFKGPICSILGSQAVIEAAKACFKKCRYNDSVIDSMTFEKKDARGDFLPACWYALKENVSPFFASLNSFLRLT